jgi:Ca-activated chloride channel homolog
MKKFALIWLLMTGIFSIVPAQSGRKIEQTPTPKPTPAANAEQPVEEKTYSESTPVKGRSTVPNLNGGAINSKPQTQGSIVQKTDAAEDDGDVLTVETNLITIPVSVFDRNGLYIPNLAQTDFKIFEDGTEQEIAYFGTSEKPFTVVLLLDTSLSTSYQIEEIQEAAIAFVNQLKPQDKVMVVEFDGNTHVLSQLTSDRQLIYKGIRKADFGYGTSLYDSVQLSFRKYLKNIEGRKAIVLFTDGVDTTSTKSGYDSTLREAEEADALIFPIYYNTYSDNRLLEERGLISDRGTSPREYALGKKYLQELAAGTGGRVFSAEAGGSGLIRTFESIAEELRRQYSIGYYPSEVGQTGQRKQIRVRVNRPNLVVRARDSYVVGAAVKPTPTPIPKKTQ